MSLTRVQNFAISLDGFGTGEGRDARHISATPGTGCTNGCSPPGRGRPGGGGGIDDAFLQLFDAGIGAEIMGAAKYGHPGWHEDPEWKGAWGPTRRSTRRSTS